MNLLDKIKARKKSKKSFSDFFLEEFGKELNDDTARKYLKGIQVYLESLGNDVNSFYKNKEEQKSDEIFAQENIKLRKSLQYARDNLRILRKEIRETSRIENTIDYLVNEIKEQIEVVPLLNVDKQEINNENGTGILHLSDIHFNKVVNLQHNKYNFEIANKRLNIYFNKVIQELEYRKCKNITICFTGDMFNLDERDEQKKTNEVVRMEALIKGYDILCFYISMLLNEGYNISMTSVVGNESRVIANLPQGNVEYLTKNNFDYVLLQMLKRKYSNNIEFLNDGDKLIDCFEIEDVNIGILHSDKLNHSNIQKEIVNLKEMIKEQYDVNPDFFLFGHIHSHLSTNQFARCSSLVGSDEYSYNGLRLYNNDISQNLIYIKNKEITTIRIDCYDK